MHPKHRKKFTKKQIITMASIGGAIVLLLAAVAWILIGGMMPSKPNDPPQSAVSGYYRYDQQFQGGRGTRDTTLSSVDVIQDGEDTVITFFFVKGGDLYNEEISEVRGVPDYVVSYLQDPDRLCVEFDGVNYIYNSQSISGEAGELVQSMILNRPVYEQERTMVFNLSQGMAFRVQEKRDQIIIRLRPAEEVPQTTSYHVSVDGYGNDIGQETMTKYGLNPTICADYENRVLLSRSYATMAQAQSVATELSQTLAGTTIEAVEIGAGGLPTYNTDAELARLNERSVVRSEGDAVKASVIAARGRLLYQSGDGAISLYAKPRERTSLKNGQLTLCDELWIEQNGEQTRLIDAGFTSILQANLSPDGKKVAFVDMMDEMNVLYVYDIEAQELTNCSEEGFGLIASDFAWDDSSTRIYGMSDIGGETSGHYQLKQIDFSKPKGERASALEELPGGDGPVYYRGGMLYFSDPESNTIYKMNPGDGRRQVLTSGVTMRINGDGTLMAVSDMLAEESTGAVDIRLMDLRDGNIKTIVEGLLVLDYKWSSDGTKLYYLADNSGDEDYPCALYVYDVGEARNTKLCDTVAYEFVPSAVNADEVMLIDILSRQGYDLPVTYALKQE